MKKIKWNTENPTTKETILRVQIAALRMLASEEPSDNMYGRQLLNTMGLYDIQVN